MAILWRQIHSEISVFVSDVSITYQILVSHILLHNMENMDLNSWTHHDDLMSMTFNKSLSHIVPFWNDTDLFCEVIWDLWTNIMHISWLISLSRSTGTVVGKVRGALPKNKTNREKKLLWMQFLKFFRKLNAMSLLKNFSIFLLSELLFQLCKQSFSLIFIYFYTSNISKNLCTKPKKDVTVSVGGAAMGKPGCGEGTGLGSPPVPSGRTTCEGPPRSGGKTVSLLAYTSLDLGWGGKPHKTNKNFFQKKINSR